MTPFGRPDVQGVLSRLKPFQRRTVDYVFDRLYRAEDSTHRFLVADEVGLGKTLVARGVIAKAVDHLWEKLETIGRIDVIYICSNATIARQNIRRLNPFPEFEATLSSRLTLLPQEIHSLEKNPVNFIALTPGTSFDLKSSLGIREERALLYWMLPASWRGRNLGALNLLQGWAGRRSFRDIVKQVLVYRQIHARIRASFEEALQQRVAADRANGREDLEARFRRIAGELRFYRGGVSDGAYAERNEIVGELRQILAKTCVDALEPDLVILDEFQRFKDLLHGEGDTSDLARALFSYSDEHTQVRLLLLSATPYKMYTLHQEEQDENHYEDFLKTVEFLDSDAERHRGFTRWLGEFREETYRLAARGADRLPVLKRQIEDHLRRVMCRTERTTAAREMLREVPRPEAILTVDDVRAFRKTRTLAALLDQPEVLEYWKSAPYLFNLMDDYKVKEALAHRLRLPTGAKEVARELAPAPGFLLPAGAVDGFEEIDAGNARLRTLLEDTMETGAWQRLWIAPALPYYQLEGAFAGTEAAGFTKRLIFSTWRVVPKAVAMLLTYEAERRIFERYDRAADRFTKYDRSGVRGLLRFARQDGRLAGMPVLGILYPSIALARLGDPLTFHRERWSSDEPPRLTSLREWLQEGIEHELRPILGPRQPSSDPFDRDERWYWAAPLLLDGALETDSARVWLGRGELAKIWSGGAQADEGEPEAWEEHLELARAAAAGELELGSPPADLSHVLAQMAIAAPGVVALRALSRVCGGSGALPSIALRDAAARIAWSLRDRFNRPEVLGVLRGEDADEPYWRRVVSYSEAGGLTAVLDEYAHVLREHLGLFDLPAEKVASEIAWAMAEAITVRAASPRYDDFQVDEDGLVRVEKKAIRSHFALPFGRARSEDEKSELREEQVRDAFNSPFWPFVLVSTSIGQEGLDFHTHCHAVVHWNLPSNPVDLEQREGRVHRYKGHAVRKNVASAFRGEALRSDATDPWEALFELARQDGGSADGAEADGLVPYWLFTTDDGARIERHAPMLPLSRDRLQLDALRRSLAVYRMVFGQPRQDDLLAYLVERLDEEALERAKELLQIDLRPPARKRQEGSSPSQREKDDTHEEGPADKGTEMKTEDPVPALARSDQARLKEAVILLEDVSFTARIADLVGIPVEKLLGSLPASARAKTQELTDTALRKAISIAILGLKPGQSPPSKKLHQLAAAASGAVGGFFGLAGVAAEVPISTTIMLRSIADIAKSEGEEITEIETQIACIQVFALGGPGSGDDETEAGYFAARAGLAKLAPQIAKGLSESAASKTVSDALAKVLARISARYGAVVSEKLAAQSVPIVGAIGGATINLLFINHFQDIARGHFMVRAMERKYEPAMVRAEYERVKAEVFGG